MDRQLPPTTGYSSILENVGATRNTGVEVALSTLLVQDWHGMRWNVEFNAAANRNRIVRLSSGLLSDPGNKWFVGYPISVAYDYQFGGIWQIQDSISGEAQRYGRRPGQIRVVEGKVTTGFFVAWLTPFAFVSGLLVLIICAYLAATYLTVDPAGEPDVRNDFRRRALWSGGVLLAIVLLLIFDAQNGAPQFFQGLENWTAIAIALGITGAAIVAFLGLWMRRFALARVAAIAEVTLILIGWGWAQYPNLITPDVSIQNSSAPAATLRLLLIALIIGAVVLFPSLAFLYYIFKGKGSRRPYRRARRAPRRSPAQLPERSRLGVLRRRRA